MAEFPDMTRVSNSRGLGALGAAVAVGGLAATAGYITYARREQRPLPKDLPLPIVRDPAGHGAYGAWRWGLLGLGATALAGGVLVFMLAA